MCVIKKHGCLLSYCSIIATNSPISLGLVISVLGKMPTKSGESSVECYGHAFLIALLYITVKGSGHNEPERVQRETMSLRERVRTSCTAAHGYVFN